MAGGSKKKKTKIASNPNRGFATTSIQSSKSKIDDVRNTTSTEDSEFPTPATQDEVAAANTHQSASSVAAKELHELTPAELEARLELSDLQQFVETHAGKVRRDASRQSSRLRTDKRVLRSQADYLTVRDWLPDELVLQILDHARLDFRSENAVVKRMKLPKDDDLLCKIWALKICLVDLEVPLDQITEVLIHMISRPALQEANGLIWGLSEALDWLALNSNEGTWLEYDFQRPKAHHQNNASDPGKEKQPSTGIQGDADERRDSPLNQSSVDVSAVSEESDLPISDVESDLEPEQLLATYLRTKTQLYELNPLAESGATKSKGGKNVKSDGLKPHATGSQKKLQRKLEKIQSDMLFDRKEAEAQWSSKKIILARETAHTRRLQLADKPNTAPHESDNDSRQNDVLDAAEKLGRDILQESETLDDEGMLGGMFDALPGVNDHASGEQNGTTHSTIRDFGKLTGLNPKRILEETCKARDSGAKATWKLVSPTTFASRHSVTIDWSKEIDAPDASYLDSVTSTVQGRRFTITSVSVAAPDIAQSEAYIATVALFVIFSGSPKEEKAHMRLPPAYRDVWAELFQLKHEKLQAADRDQVKELRSLIRDNSPTEEEDDVDEVVFNASIRRRLDGTSGASTPHGQGDANKQIPTAIADDLAGRWASKTSTPSYQRMLQGRMNLPMYQFKGVALEIISKNQVTILCGETGCGKSTQLPAFILEDQLSKGRPCKIYCTEPRRISAISLAQRVSEELGEHKGDVGTHRSLVGYAIRLESHTTAETRLIYATVGIVLRMLERADGINDVTHLVIDEVHERSIDTDFLLIILRSLMLRRPDLKVILMSATVDAQKFSNYLDGAPIITVPGRTFPVRAHFLEDAIELTGHTNDDAAENVAEDVDEFEEMEGSNKSGTPNELQGYSKATRATLAKYDEYCMDYSLIVKLLQKLAFDPNLQQYSKAVLIFLPGISEIRQLNDILGGSPAFSQGWRVHPLHSSFSSEDQQAAFEVPPPGIRKIVLATNIAETGITIPDVTCVIDTGKHKEMRFDERRQLSKLILSFIARANAKQRRGRAGRVQEGICFHLYTKHRHDELMAEQQTPEMLRLSLQDLVMRVKICKLGDIEHALSQALDPPSSKNIRRAIDALIEVDALTPEEELTSLGSQIAKLPLDAQLGKFVLLGSIFGCLDFALTVAAALTSKSPFLSPMHAKKQADTVRLGFKRGDSDLLTLYNAYCAWRKTCTTAGISEHQFCNKNFLSSQNLTNIEDLKGQLLNALADAGFVHLGPAEKHALSKVRPNSRQRHFVELPASARRADEDDITAASLAAWSFYPKIVKQEGKGWRNIANNQSLGLHPTSVNKGSLNSDIKLLSFYSIMQSSSRFTNAQETTPAQEFALVLLAGEAVFHIHAGVIVIDGNRLRFKVRDYKTMIVLKTLRAKLKEVLTRSFKYPGRELAGKHKMWMEIVEKLFVNRQKSSS